MLIHVRGGRLAARLVVVVVMVVLACGLALSGQDLLTALLLSVVAVSAAAATAVRLLPNRSCGEVTA